MQKLTNNVNRLHHAYKLNPDILQKHSHILPHNFNLQLSEGMNLGLHNAAIITITSILTYSSFCDLQNAIKTDDHKDRGIIFPASVAISSAFTMNLLIPVITNINQDKASLVIYYCSSAMITSCITSSFIALTLNKFDELCRDKIQIGIGTLLLPLALAGVLDHLLIEYTISVLNPEIDQMLNPAGTI